MNSPRKIIYNWVPSGTQKLLDVGCSWGNEAFSFAKKSKEVYGVDISEKYIEKAKKKYPDLNFFVAEADQMPFQDCFFDVIVMSEVLEHVDNEVASLNEVYRLLAPQGILILGTPHKGMFSFLDPANLKFFVRKIMPALFDVFVGWKTERNPNYKLSVLSQGIHRHYFLRDLKNLFGRSNWKENYRIEKVARHGLFMGPLSNIFKALLASVFGEKIAKPLVKPLAFLAFLENCFSFGKYSYQVKLLVKKQ